MSKIVRGLILLFSCLFIMGAAPGCKAIGRFLDKTVGNNDGHFDVPEIGMVYKSSLGVDFVVEYTAEEGIQLTDVQFRSPKGNLYAEADKTDEGSFLIKNGDSEFWVKKIE